MNFIQTSYQNALKQNEEQEKIWLQNKKSLEDLQNNLIFYNESLKPSVLVPVCNRVMMKGHLIHTNEILVSLGCNYFTKCSSKRAQGIIEHRLLKAALHLKELRMEKLFLSSQLEHSSNMFSDDCQEIIEPFNEQKEEEWKQQHILNVRKWKKSEKNDNSDIDHEEIMNKLELLELEEEIEQLHNTTDFTNTQSNATYSMPEEDQNVSANLNLDIPNKQVTQKTESRESAIRKRLFELKKSKTKCVTEEDVMKRLDQLQEEEDLKDELESLRIGSDIEEESSEDSSESTSTDISDDDRENSTIKMDIESTQRPKRRISFADETLKMKDTTAVLNFSHSHTPATKNDFIGELKSPSDIYQSFPQCFKKETKSIIKNSHRVREEIHNIDLRDQTESHDIDIDKNTPQHVVIGDIVEHSKGDNTIEPELRTEKNPHRPVSKFKSMRMSSKQSNYS